MEKESIIKLIESLNLKKALEEIEIEKTNISIGAPRKKGIYNNIESRVVSANEVRKELKLLEEKEQRTKEIEKDIEIMKDLVKEIHDIYKYKYLIESMRNLLVEGLSDNKEFDRLKETYKDLCIKEEKLNEKPVSKKTKEIFKIFTKYKKVTFGSNKGPNHLDDLFASAGFKTEDKSNFLSYIRQETWEEYHNKPGRLGADIEYIEYAKRNLAANNGNHLSYNYKEAYDKLNKLKYFREKYHIKGTYAEVNDLISKYEKIVNLAKYVTFTEEILIAFEKTEISQSQMFLKIKDIVKEQKTLLDSLINKADKLYEKSKIKNKIDVESRLKEIQNKLLELEQLIEDSKKNNETYRLENLKSEYYKLRYEMEQILENNQDLNLLEYNMPKKEFDEKVVKEEKEEKSQEINNPENKTIEPEFIDDLNDFKLPELDSVMQIHRSTHYQNYMKEKVLNSPLGQIPFSEYLRTVAPNLGELISVEELREKFAKTIYKEYIKYYASLKNKVEALSFEEYAQNKYGIDSIDRPIEYEQDLDEGMTR